MRITGFTILGLLALATLSCSTSSGPSGDDDIDDACPDPCPDDPDDPVDDVDAGTVAELADPGADGPYAVGVRTVDIVDPSRSRPLRVDIWYPCDGGGESNEYALEIFGAPLASMPSPARRDATPSAGTWPAILFSHGFGGVRFQSYFLTERLASHGFVVVAPDHSGNTLGDVIIGGDDGAAQSAIDRPLDILFLLDWLLGGGASIAIDGDRVAVSGHSFGGWASFESASRDPRLAAVIALAPGFRSGATPDVAATLERPLLIAGGSVDGTTPFDSDQLAPYELAAPPKHLVRINGAGHLDFSNLCEVPIASAAVDDGCDPASIEPAIVHARTSLLATAFAKLYLTGDDRYAQFLEPDFVVGLGNVDYWAELP